MRIIGGKYSRRVLRPPKSLPVRPTTDLAKEGLFNILMHRVDFNGKAALDLFTGTGSIAFELFSRGCRPVVAVDKNFQCIRFVGQASEGFGMDDLQAVRADVFRFVKTTPLKFDLIFADPPYDLEGIESIPSIVYENVLLNAGGLLIVEHPGSIDFSQKPNFEEHRKYGKVNFSFFR